MTHATRFQRRRTYLALDPSSRSAHTTLHSQFFDPQAREDYAQIIVDINLSRQIKALRKQRGWTQRELSERTGITQSLLSMMEQPGHSRWKVDTLLRLAAAFDVALTVRFDSFGTVLDTTTGPHSAPLECTSFGDDPVFYGPREVRKAEG